MKPIIKIIFFIFTAINFISCGKGSIDPNQIVTPTPTPQSPAPTPPCPDGPLIAAQLEMIGLLSVGRSHMLCASAGNKIFFVGGYKVGGNWWNDPSIIDIYDIPTNTWSATSIYTGFRDGAAISSVGNKIFFAGGGDGIGDNQTAEVNIYNITTGNWSSANLSLARQGLAAATLGNKVFFAGGGYLNSSANWVNSDVVDIYDNSTNTWSTSKLSEGRMDLAAISIGNKIYFAGGRSGMTVSKTIDIYDATTNTWSTSALSEPRAHMASIGVNNKIFWAGGLNSFSSTSPSSSDNVEIRDITTGVSSFNCIEARHGFTAVQKDDNIIFFTGQYTNSLSGTRFEIYNTTTNTWSTGVLDQKILNSAIISVNNTIYVAGGSSSPGEINNEVWKLKF